MPHGPKRREAPRRRHRQRRQSYAHCDVRGKLRSYLATTERPGRERRSAKRAAPRPTAQSTRTLGASKLSRISMFVAVAWLYLLTPVIAQDAVPSEMLLQRTLFIKVGNMTGTAFKIDHMGKVYLVTARHVVAGLPEIDATIQVRRAGNWENLHTVKTLFPPRGA